MHRSHQNHPVHLLRRFASLALAMVFIIGGVACTPFATYPPVSGIEPLAPGLYPVPQVMGKSLRTAYDKSLGTFEQDGETPELVFALPAGISAGNWRQVAVQSGVEGARQLTASDYEDGVPFWFIEQVRIRNQRAEVDVVFPVDDEYERATVILESDPFTAYEVKFFQRWRVPVDQPEFTFPAGQAPQEESDLPEAEAVQEEVIQEEAIEEEAIEEEVLDEDGVQDEVVESAPEIVSESVSEES